MNWFLDVFADDYLMGDMIGSEDYRGLSLVEDRSGPCEDDCEKTAPFVGMLPEETDHEEPSPLDFGVDGRKNIGMRFVDRPCRKR